VAAKFAAAAGLAAAVGALWIPQDVLSVIFIALICTRPAVSTVLRDAWEQVFASLAGTAVALLVFSVLGQGPAGVAVAAASAWALATALRWSGNSVVIVLLSVAYLGQPTTDPWLDRAVLRESSLLLGVLVALLVNIAAAPWMGRYNLRVRFLMGIARVRELLSSSGRALQRADLESLAQRLAHFDREYAALHAIRDELNDLRRDAQIVPAWFSAGPVAVSDWVPAAAYDLEQVIHHVQDVAGGARRLLVEAGGDLPAADAHLLSVASAALLAGALALEAGALGDWSRVEEVARAQVRLVRELDTRIEAPLDIDERLGPRLWIMVSVAAALNHVARLGARMGETPERLDTPVRVA
jgi:hypothetical protein